jgi:hypothetical protein
VSLGSNSRGVSWLNGSLDCLRLEVDSKVGCDCVIDAPSLDILWVYVRLLARGCETILMMWW